MANKVETKAKETPEKKNVKQAVGDKKNSSTKKKNGGIKKMVDSIKKSRKSSKNEAKPKAFEDKPDLDRLVLLVVVVDLGVSRVVEKLLQNLGSSMQFTHNGRGTASKEILNVLGVVDNSKGVVNAIINEDCMEDVRTELNIFFAASKKNRGIAFTIPFSSVVGVRIYKYLSQTI